RLEKINTVIQECLSNGILLTSGMMISPSVDDIGYMERLPGLLRDSGICIPQFLSFEIPFPGTPKFDRLSSSAEPAFLPNTFMYDYDGNTLVTRPKHDTIEDYVAAYRKLRHSLPSPQNALAKLRAQVPPLAKSGSWLSLGGVIYLMARLHLTWKDNPQRT